MYGGDDGVDVVPDQRPPVGKQYHHANVGLADVLLVLNVLVGGDQDIIALFCRQTDEFSVSNP